MEGYSDERGHSRNNDRCCWKKGRDRRKKTSTENQSHFNSASLLSSKFIHCTKYNNVYPSIHLSIFHRLFGVRSRGQQPERGSPDFPLSSHFIRLFWGDPEAFSGQPRDTVLQYILGLPGGLLPVGRALNASPWRRLGGILTRCPNHLTWHLSARRSSSSSRMAELLTLSLRESPPRPSEEAHFSLLYLRSCYFSHYPKLVTIGQGRNKDQRVNLYHNRPAQSSHHRRCRTDPSVDLPLYFQSANSHPGYFTLSCEQIRWGSEVTDWWSQQDHNICNEQRPILSLGTSPTDCPRCGPGSESGHTESRPPA